MSPSLRPLVALLLVAPALLFGACILDLSNLSGGTTSSSTTHAGGSGGSGGAALDAGLPEDDAACPASECTVCNGTCPDGGCVPVQVHTRPTADRPWAVAESDSAVYWVNQHGYTVARRAQGKTTSEYLTGATAPSAIAVSGGYVVWADLDGLWGCPAETCDEGRKKLFASADPGSITSVVYDGQFAYFTDRGTGQLTGKVLRCAPSDCASPLEIATGQLSPQSIALTGSSVVWSDLGTGEKNGNLYKASKTGQGMMVLASALILPTSVAADDNDVYFTQWSADGKVFRCPHNAGYCDTPADVAPGAGLLALPFDLALSGGRVYWSNSGDGSIQSCPLPGCGPDQPALHADSRVGLRKLALGQSCLYWVDDTAGGGVFQVPR